MKERTKRAIDWLTLLPLGFMPATKVWFHYTHNDHPSVIWLVLLIIDGLLVPASFIWLGLRMDKIRIVHWVTYNIAMFPFRALLFILGCLAIVILIQRLWR
jgi:hypothetical protein